MALSNESASILCCGNFILAEYSPEVRITKGEMLGGVPIEDVRKLLRRNAGLSFSAESIVDDLSITNALAGRLVEALLGAGYIREVKQSHEGDTYYERTLDGSTLAAATMAPPLRRSTVERLLKEVVERAKAINENDAYAFRVARIVLFGSALGTKERPNDIDLAVTLSKRHQDPAEQRRAEELRRRGALAGGRRFPNITAEVFWPETEVRLALKGRARGLSLLDGDAAADLGADSKVIFEEPVPVQMGNRVRRPSTRRG